MEPLGGRLSLATAFPLWGVLSMLGWLIIAHAAILLFHFPLYY